MFDERAFRKAVEIVEGKLSRGEYSDYDHGCGLRCVVGKAYAHMIGREPHLGEVVAVVNSTAIHSLWNCGGMPDTHDQQEGALKARTYLAATEELADA